ncbi:MAG: histidine phosphatase family protein [Oscillospiraceae bacterium]|nr:histidine phosphatase family protein [Oscillospiraceae bacterium]
MNLTLLRHGVTEGNLRRLYYGKTDLPLCREGEEGLRLLAQRGNYPTAPRYYVSGLRRTVETLKILYGNVPYETLSDLREIDCGDWEMKHYEELKDDPAYLRWCEDTAHTPCPGGESFQAVQKRALAALTPLLGQDEDAVCITHGGVIALLLQAWFPVEENENYRRVPMPGTGYQIRIEGGIPVSYCAVPPEEI